MERTQPERTPLSEPWFEACNEGRLLIQRCEACGHYQFYPRLFCTACSAGQPAWVEASGDARIASFTVVRRSVSRAYEAPYVVALVALEEGPRMMSTIVDWDSESLRIGADLTLRFERWSDDVSLPVFTTSEQSRQSGAQQQTQNQRQHEYEYKEEQEAEK